MLPDHQDQPESRNHTYYKAVIRPVSLFTTVTVEGISSVFFFNNVRSSTFITLELTETSLG